MFIKIKANPFQKKFILIDTEWRMIKVKEGYYKMERK